MINTSISTAFFILLTTITLSFQKPKIISCDKYRKGKFTQFIHNKSKFGHWRQQEILIDRNDSIQIEVVLMVPNDSLFYRINWTDNCSYQLKFLRATNSLADSIHRYYSRTQVKKYTIKNGTDLYYIENSGRKSDTIWLRQ